GPPRRPAAAWSLRILAVGLAATAFLALSLARCVAPLGLAPSHRAIPATVAACLAAWPAFNHRLAEHVLRAYLIVLVARVLAQRAELHGGEAHVPASRGPRAHFAWG